MLLLNSINMLTLAASTMAGVAGSYDGAPVLALKLSSALLFSAATGMLLATVTSWKFLPGIFVNGAF